MLEEQKKEREDLKKAADVRDLKMEEMRRQMEEVNDKIEELKKKVLAPSPPSLSKSDNIAGFKSQLDELHTVVQKLLFKNAARDEE